MVSEVPLDQVRSCVRNPINCGYLSFFLKILNFSRIDVKSWLNIQQSGELKNGAISQRGEEQRFEHLENRLFCDRPFHHTSHLSGSLLAILRNEKWKRPTLMKRKKSRWLRKWWSRWKYTKPRIVVWSKLIIRSFLSTLLLLHRLFINNFAPCFFLRCLEPIYLIILGLWSWPYVTMGPIY